MAGSKTHKQQLRIMEERENTSNASDDFNGKDELKRSKQERDAHTGDERLRDDGVELTDKDDRQMIRGETRKAFITRPARTVDGARCAYTRHCLVEARITRRRVRDEGFLSLRVGSRVKSSLTCGANPRRESSL